jgi:beta-N-acetylhexosaminidase
MSDDLSMKALAAPIRHAAEAVIRAGSDIALHCNGSLDEMREAAAGVPALAGPALARFEAAVRVAKGGAPIDVAAAEKALDYMLRRHASGVESV